MISRSVSRWRLGAAVFLLIGGNASARVETLAIPCAEERICLWDRPVLAAPAEWELLQEQSRTSHVSVYGPSDASSESPAAFMIARAVRRIENQTRQQFIDLELDYALSHQLDLHAEPTDSLLLEPHNDWLMYRIASARDNSPVVSMAFGEDGDFHVVLVMSSRSDKVHAALLPKFHDWIVRYQAGEIVK